jgi:hypothetical protein
LIHDRPCLTSDFCFFQFRSARASSLEGGTSFPESRLLSYPSTGKPGGPKVVLTALLGLRSQQEAGAAERAAVNDAQRQSLFFANALPECDFRYVSKFKALDLSGEARYRIALRRPPLQPLLCESPAGR